MGFPMPLAPIWTRTWCWFIDSTLSFVLSLLVVSIFFALLNLSFGLSDESSLFLILVFGGLFGLSLTYFAASYVWWGRTPGMMLGRLYVADLETFARLSWGRAYLRSLVLNLAQGFGLIAIIWIAITSSDPLRRGPHDKAGRSIVMRRAV